jgi:murein DD-endopeptidase MepM/ murein hydrolase activator NlpD
MDGYLYAEESFRMTASGHVDLCTVKLLGGDANGDGTIDILDLSYVGGKLFSTDPRADINGDGKVDILDLVLVGANFGKSAPSPWTSRWAFPVGDLYSGAGWLVTNPLGNSWQDSSGKWYRGHLGEDWARSGGGSLGEPVYAVAAGDVIIVRPNCGNYNDIVVIKHFVRDMDEPMYSFYGHMDAEGWVRQGDTVKKRQQIGVLDDPVDFSPHLHFEIKNHTALIHGPFSSCTDISRGWYISAGYSGRSGDYSGGEYYDPSQDGIIGNRYYHPTRFIQARQ